MAPDGSAIVASWFNHSAPTGEGQCYQTADGQRWRSIATPGVISSTSDATGSGRVVMIGNSIHPVAATPPRDRGGE